jgi:hypothetical protein
MWPDPLDPTNQGDSAQDWRENWRERSVIGRNRLYQAMDGTPRDPCITSEPLAGFGLRCHVRRAAPAPVGTPTLRESSAVPPRAGSAHASNHRPLLS